MININKLIQEVDQINKKNIKIKKALSDLECDICCSRLITRDSTFKCDKHNVCKNCYIMMDKCPFCRSGKDKTDLMHKNSMFGLVECTPKYMEALEQASKIYGWELHINHTTNILKVFNPNTGRFME